MKTIKITNEETIKGNILIAEFMGYSKGSDFQYLKHPLTGYDTNIDTLPYNISFDWLMPVVERIESLGFGTRVGTQMCLIISKKIDLFEVEILVQGSKIEAVYKAVICFIEWYNQQNK